MGGGSWPRASSPLRGLAFVLAEQALPIFTLVHPILLAMLFAPLRSVVVVPLAILLGIAAKLLMLEPSEEQRAAVKAFTDSIQATKPFEPKHRQSCFTQRGSGTHNEAVFINDTFKPALLDRSC